MSGLKKKLHISFWNKIFINFSKSQGNQSFLCTYITTQIQWKRKFCKEALFQQNFTKILRFNFEQNLRIKVECHVFY